MSVPHFYYSATANEMYRCDDPDVLHEGDCHGDTPLVLTED